MSQARRIIDQSGAEGVIEMLDGKFARLRLHTGRTVAIPREALNWDAEANAYRVQLDLTRLGSRVEEQTVIPLAAEELTVEKHTVENTVRVQKRVREETVVVDEVLRRDSVDIERVPMDRYVDQPLEPRYEGETMIIPILEEVLVVEKRLLLREEIRITRRQSVVRDPQEHVLRREEATVTRDQTDQSVE